MNFLTWYESTPWHVWWVENVWRPSWTKLTTAVYGLPAVLLTVAQKADVWAHDSTISSYLSQMNVPNWVPIGLAGLALFHYVASGHDD